jgi:hypothetical protein
MHTLTHSLKHSHTDLTATTVHSGPPEEQSIPLKIPKKTKLYVEQTQRERGRLRYVLLECVCVIKGYVC